MVNMKINTQKTYTVNEMQEYLESIIGSIECGSGTQIENEYIVRLEKARVKRSKEVINNLLKELPLEEVTYLYHKEVRGLINVDEIDALDAELLINYSVLGVFNVIKNKNLTCLKHYSDQVVIENNELARKIINKAKYYDTELMKLIVEKENFIERLLTTNDPTFDFIDAKKNKKYIKTR